MDFFEIRIYTQQYSADFLIGLLNDLPVNGYEEGIEMLIAYVPTTYGRNTIEASLKECLPKDIHYDVQEIQDQNWNAIWESQFDPIVVNGFCNIRASFHELNSEVNYDIIIDPRMAFGTGHHETTFMMVESMRELKFESKRVLDYGCGTGILAILASKMGAGHVIAIDNDLNAYENCKVNVEVNDVTNVECKLSDLHSGVFDPFDIILANINLNVLKNNVSQLANNLVKDGILLISGILESDKDSIENTFEPAGFKSISFRQKNGWALVKFQRI